MSQDTHGIGILYRAAAPVDPMDTPKHTSNMCHPYVYESIGLDYFTGYHWLDHLNTKGYPEFPLPPDTLCSK